PARGYAVYVASGDYVAYTPPTSRLAGPFDEMRGESNPNSGEGEFQVYGLYPNPVGNNKVTLDFQLPGDDSISIEIVDLRGTTLKQFSRFEKAGRHTVELDVSGLAKGAYLYKFSYRGNTNVSMMMVN